MQAVWDDKSSVFAHFALTPWSIPDQECPAHDMDDCRSRQGLSFSLANRTYL